MTWLCISENPPPKDGTKINLARRHPDGLYEGVVGWWCPANPEDKDDDDGWVLGPSLKVHDRCFTHWRHMTPLEPV